MKLKQFVLIAMFLVPVLSLLAAPAKEVREVRYPTKPITLIVSFAAGGGTDIGARLLTPLVEAELGQPIVVVNKTGAGGWVGWTELSRAAPDGYTIGYINTPALIMGYINPELRRDANLDSFVPIVNHVWDATVWAVLPDSPFRTARDLLNHVRANPGTVSKSTTGAHTQHHINAIELQKQGYQFNVVHTRGAADSIAMALGGHINVLSAGVGEVTTLAREGKLRVLAVLDGRRAVSLPDVPLFREATGIELISFSSRGIAAPAGTPRAIIDRLAAAFEKAIRNPKHIEEMEKLGLELRFMPPAEYNTFLREYEQTLRRAMGW